MSAPDEGGNPWKSEAGGFGDRSNQHALKHLLDASLHGSRTPREQLSHREEHARHIAACHRSLQHRAHELRTGAGRRDGC